ncbi:hypothetical protein AKJ16_DCAP15880 [Drosera capensis]
MSRPKYGPIGKYFTHFRILGLNISTRARFSARVSDHLPWRIFHSLVRKPCEFDAGGCFFEGIAVSDLGLRRRMTMASQIWGSTEQMQNISNKKNEGKDLFANTMGHGRVGNPDPSQPPSTTIGSGRLMSAGAMITGDAGGG